MNNIPLNFKRRLFVAGFLAGIMVTSLCVALIALFTVQKGVVVYLDSDEVAEMISETVTKQLSEELSRIVKKAKKDVPRVVRTKMTGQQIPDRMEIAGFVFKMPEELQEQINGYILENVEAATKEVLDGLNTDEIAKKLSKEIRTATFAAIDNELDGQRFNVKVFNYFPMQVLIRIDSHGVTVGANRNSLKQ